LLLGFIVVYLLITIAVGFLSARFVKTSSDFLLAGRSLPFFLSTSALFATWFGSETIFGATSEFVAGGLQAVVEDPFGAALCLFLFGMFFARKLYRLNLLTLGDFFKQRYGRKTEVVSSIFMVPSYFGYIAAQLVAMALILQGVTGISLFLGIVLSALVVTLYTYVGGMWAISITDFIQSILIVGGLLVLAWYLADQAGGVRAVLEEAPPGTFRFIPDADAGAWMRYLAAWAVLGLGSIPSQDVFQRVMSSRSENVAVASCYASGFLYLTVALLPLFIALCARTLYPELLGEDNQGVLPAMVLAHSPLALQVVFFGALLSAIMSTTSGALLAPASIFSENILRPLLSVTLTDKQFLVLTRLSVLAMSLCATVMATLRANIYELVAESSILSLVSLFVPLVLGIYWKRANAYGAILSMVLGLGTWILFSNVEWWDVPSLIPGLLASFVGMGLGIFIKSR
jgi:solute:Na+ symporter, SSS family